MLCLIFAIPLLSLLLLGGFALDEWEEEKRKAKEEAEFQKEKKEFEEKYLTNASKCDIIYTVRASRE
jgi:DNA-binding transcriptional regulator/RsmH inhibitor MraZ